MKIKKKKKQIKKIKEKVQIKKIQEEKVKMLKLPQIKKEEKIQHQVIQMKYQVR